VPRFALGVLRCTKMRNKFLASKEATIQRRVKEHAGWYDKS
jgi:hypothetical protein